MTSEEIKDTSPIDLSSNSWLKEIAYHLALLSENRVKFVEQLTSNSQSFHVSPNPKQRRN